MTQLNALTSCHAAAHHGRCRGIRSQDAATLTAVADQNPRQVVHSPLQHPILSNYLFPIRAITVQATIASLTSQNSTALRPLTEAMQSCSLFSTARPLLPARQPASRSTRFVLCKAQEPKETSSGQDSYSVSFRSSKKLFLSHVSEKGVGTVLLTVSLQKIEAPVRGGIPDGGKPVDERNWGQNDLNPKIKAESSDPSMRVPGTDFSASETFR